MPATSFKTVIVHPGFREHSTVKGKDRHDSAMLAYVIVTKPE